MYQVGNIYIISIISVIGGGLFGFDISSMSAIIATPAYKCYFDQSDDGSCTGPSPDVQGGIVASMAGGSWLASLCSGFVADMFGRRTAIQLGAVIWCLGCVIVAAAQNIPMLIVGRIINGFAVGICSAQVPVYISEIAQPSKRGRLVGMQQWAITWGIMIMFYISYGCSFINGPTAFRIPWALQAIPAIILFFGMMFLPESPRWYASKDKWEQCEQVLILTHGKGDPNSPWVAREFAEIKEWLEIERQGNEAGFMSILSPRYLNRTHIAVFTQIWSQLTGMNVMMYYITDVFQMAGLSGNNLLLSSSIQYIINVVMTVPALIWVDRLGRRPVLLAGSTLMMTWLWINAGVLKSYGHPTDFNLEENKSLSRSVSWQVSGPPSKVVIACSYLFVASFAPTWGPVSWIYPPELFPNHLRAKAVALSTSANWAFNFALGYFVPPAFENIKWQVYIVFAMFALAMTIHVFFFFPETAGKPLEEITDIFENPNGIPGIGTPAWRTSVSTRHVERLEHGEGLDEKGRHASVDDHSPERHENVTADKAV